MRSAGRAHQVSGTALFVSKYGQRDHMLTTHLTTYAFMSGSRLKGNKLSAMQCSW